LKRKHPYLLVLLIVLLFNIAPARCTSLEKTEFMPLEQVNIRIDNVAIWIRPITVTVLLNDYSVATSVYDAGSDLYVSFLMPNGEPENLTLRVSAVDLNQTNAADSMFSIIRVESYEFTQLKGNVSSLEDRIGHINSRLDNLTVLEQELRDTLTELQSGVGGVNSSLISEINNFAFELSQELDALQEELSTLNADTMDLKALVVGINDATQSGNIITQDVQNQVAEIQETVYKALAFSIISAVTSAVMVAVVLRRSSEKK
jgi:prefoldin subunit 5